MVMHSQSTLMPKGWSASASGGLDFYSSREWRRLRARYRKAHPLCRRCGARAEHVDHVIEISTAPERKLDWWNLQALCQSCHNEKTAADKGGRLMRPHGGCDADGMPTDPRHPWNVARETARNATQPGGRGG
jgi:HNH endonuclease